MPHLTLREESYKIFDNDKIKAPRVLCLVSCQRFVFILGSCDKR